MSWAVGFTLCQQRFVWYVFRCDGRDQSSYPSSSSSTFRLATYWDLSATDPVSVDFFIPVSPNCTRRLPHPPPPFPLLSVTKLVLVHSWQTLRKIIFIFQTMLGFCFFSLVKTNIFLPLVPKFPATRNYVSTFHSTWIFNVQISIRRQCVLLICADWMKFSSVVAMVFASCHGQFITNEAVSAKSFFLRLLNFLCMFFQLSSLQFPTILFFSRHWESAHSLLMILHDPLLLEVLVSFDPDKVYANRT